MTKQELVNSLALEIALLSTTDNPIEIDGHLKKIERLKSEYTEVKKLEGSVEWNRFLVFNSEEIRKMPKRFQKLFKINHLIATVSLRSDNVYRVSCRAEKTYGVNIQVYSRDLAIAKQKFIDALKKYEPSISGNVNKKAMMNEYIEKYIYDNSFDVVSRSTRHKELEYLHHIKPFLEGVEASKMTASICNEILQRLMKEGKNRTAEDVRSILNQSLLLVVGDNLLQKNPMDYVKKHKHARTTRERLDNKTINDIFADDNPRYGNAIKVMLLVGARPNELPTMTLIDDRWIEIANSKLRKGEESTRKIPVTEFSLPFIKQYLTYDTVSPRNLSTYFKEKYGDRKDKKGHNYQLYYTRHTFATVCAECGISKYCVDKWLNHAGEGMTDTVYTHIDEEFEYTEMQKLKYKKL